MTPYPSSASLSPQLYSIASLPPPSVLSNPAFHTIVTLCPGFSCILLTTQVLPIVHLLEHFLFIVLCLLGTLIHPGLVTTSNVSRAVTALHFSCNSLHIVLLSMFWVEPCAPPFQGQDCFLISFIMKAVCKPFQDRILF